MTAPRARILHRPGVRSCTSHEWVLPYPSAVVRRCARCGAWLVPSGGSRVTGDVTRDVVAPQSSPTDRIIANIIDVLGAEVLSTMIHHRCDHWITNKVRRVSMLNPHKMRTRNFSLPGNFCDGTDDVQRYPVGWRCAVHAPQQRQERKAAA